MKKIRVGDLAPEFDWTASTGEQVRLNDFRDRKAAVLFFAVQLSLAAERHVREAFRVVEELVRAGADQGQFAR